MLTAEHVNAVFRECLAQTETDSRTIVVEGIANKAAFDPVKVLAHRTEIRALLVSLPVPFRAESEGGGGGWSFLNACDTAEGKQWTGFHQVMEELFMVGEAAGLVRCLVPRDLWPALPGGMPYYVVEAGSDAV